MIDRTDSILITGGRGLLAGGLARVCQRRGLQARGIAREECDISSEADLRRTFRNYRVSTVLNAAGFAHVDRCEAEPEQAQAVNSIAVGTLASVCRELGLFLVHFSTDFIFDGERAPSTPYVEDDIPRPLNVYGRSKLLGETLLKQHAVAERWLLVRTAWLFGPEGQCLPRRVLDEARKGRAMQVVNDQIGSPTFVDDLAHAVVDLLQTRGGTGLFHVVNRGSASWHELAQATLDEWNVRGNLSPISTPDWTRPRPAQAIRPSFSVLNVNKLERRIGRRMRDWRSTLHDFRFAVEQSAVRDQCPTI